jgi:hypothetical protein
MNTVYEVVFFLAEVGIVAAAAMSVVVIYLKLFHPAFRTDSVDRRVGPADRRRAVAHPG